MLRKYVWLGMGLLALFVAVGAGLYTGHGSEYHAKLIQPPQAAPEISMTDAQGSPFALSSLRGRVVLLYFGFVNCPDECPLTMAHLKQALSQLGEAARQVQVVMVSTDPLHDTPAAMQNFLAHFDTGYIGIPGTASQLAQIWNAYGVVVLDGGETHSSYTYVIDRQGEQRLLFTPDSSPEDMAADLKNLLLEK